jgi:hypothetical protein
MTVKKEISLLPESENPNSFNARLVKWMTGSGRAIIICTELIVVIAFISRFWLDRKNADISEVIRQEQAILETTKDFENEFSDLQQKLKLIKSFYANQPDYTRCISTLVNSTPQDLIYNNVNIKKDEKLNKIIASVTLTAYREESIVDFITNLTLNSDISTVNLNKIEKKPRENKYSINIDLVFKDQPVKKS